MATRGSGFVTDSIQQSASSDPTFTYASEDFVNKSIKNYVNTNPTVNLTISDGLSIVSSYEASTLSTVIVGLSARLNDLEDVQLGPPLSYQNKYLQYVGTCWVPGPGASPGDLSLQNMTDVFPKGMKENSVLFSSNGISAYFKEDTSIESSNLQYGNGINISKTSTYPYKATITTDFKDFGSSDSDEESDYYLMVKPNGNTRRIKKKNINANQFSDFPEAVNSALTFHSTSLPTEPIGLNITQTTTSTTFNLNLEEYLTGAGGILPISHGGTSGNTSATARQQLGLSYNHHETCYPYDIMGYSSPEFRNTMLGDSIHLIGGACPNGVSVVMEGSGYSVIPTTTFYITGESGERVFMDITTGPAGVVKTAHFKNPIKNFTDFASDDVYELIDHNGAGSGASIGISANISYINFGLSRGDEGVGFKYENRELLVKPDRLANWETLNQRFGVSELTDVSTTNFENADFLVYNGTSNSFFGVSIHGAITVGASGRAEITTGGLSISHIDFGPNQPSVQDFQNIIGTTSPIQIQLDNTLTYTEPPYDIPNRNLLVRTVSAVSGGSTATIKFNHDSPYNDYPQVPIIKQHSVLGVSFNNVGESFEDDVYDESDIPNLKICLLENKTTIDVGVKKELTEFLHMVVEEGTGGGLTVNSNNQIALKIEGLSTMQGSSINNYNDFVAIGPSLPTVLTSNKKLHLRDLLKVPIYSTPAAANPLLTETPGSIAFFQDSVNHPGTSFLGIALPGNNWYGVSGFQHII